MIKDIGSNICVTKGKLLIIFMLLKQSIKGFILFPISKYVFYPNALTLFFLAYSPTLFFSGYSHVLHIAIFSRFFSTIIIKTFLWRKNLIIVLQSRIFSRRVAEGFRRVRMHPPREKRVFLICAPKNKNVKKLTKYI